MSSKLTLMPCEKAPMERWSSPVGGSTLMISAPRSASMAVQNGPARTRLKSSTVTPAKGLVEDIVISSFGARAGEP